MRKYKKFTKLVFCYTLSSIIALMPATSSLAASTESSSSIIKETISSLFQTTKNPLSSEDNASTVTESSASSIDENETISSDYKKENSTEEKEEESFDDKKDNSTEEKKEHSSDDKKDDSTEEKKEHSSDDKKDDSTEEKKEHSSDDKKEDSTEEKKDDSSNDKKDDSTEEKKEHSSDDKKDDSTEEKKEHSSDDKKDDSTEEKKENSSDDKKEDSTEEKKDHSSDDKKEDSTEEKKEDSSNDKKDGSTEEKKEDSSNDKKDDYTEEKKEESSAEKKDDSTKESSTATTAVDTTTTVEDIEIPTENPKEFEDNELLVQFKTELSENRINEITGQLPDTTLKSYSDGIAVFTAKSKKIIEKDIEILGTIQEVSIIQPNYKYSFSSVEHSEEDSSIIPNDTFFDKQWGLLNASTDSIQSNSTPRIDVNVLQAWDELNSNSEVIVAVLDTGVDYQHKDLKDHMWYNKAETSGSKNADDDNNGYIDDIHGWDFYNDDASVCHYSGTTADKNDNDNHGTRCAGIIAATANNNFGIAGVASNINVKIMPLKVSGGPNAEGDTANIIKAIKYASYNGAKICNASWNCDSSDPALELAIKESNMLFVCSAGNGYGTNIDSEPSYPCSYDLPNVIGVTSIDPDGTLSYFSNYGKNSVAMAAPGSNICSTIVGKYGYDSGTSMATPFVTGIAAMLYAYNPNLYPVKAKQLLLDSTTSLPALEDKVTTGGMIDAGKAVANIQSKKYTKDTVPPTIVPTILPRKTGAYLSVSISDKGGSYTRIRRYAYGKHTASYFKNGNRGKVLVSGTKPFVTTEGYYTIYAQDNAGNESVKVIKVSFDKSPPTLSVSYKKVGKYYEITVKSSDSDSGLSSVRYSKDKHTTNYFKTKGTVLSSGSKMVRRSAKGTYSFYAKDKAGNTVLKRVTIK